MTKLSNIQEVQYQREAGFQRKLPCLLNPPPPSCFRLLLAKQLGHPLSVSPASLRDFCVFARRSLPPSETSSEEFLLSSVISLYPFQHTVVPSFSNFCSFTLFSPDFLYGFPQRNV
ncbi:hypothetical protein SLA2020_040940 [Shorea laevis]